MKQALNDHEDTSARLPWLPDEEQDQKGLDKLADRLTEVQSGVVDPGGKELTDPLQEQPVVVPQVSHLRHVPLRTIVKFLQVVQESPV